MKRVGVVLDCHLTFFSYVIRSCKRFVPFCAMLDKAWHKTKHCIRCCLILLRLDYYNSLLYGDAPIEAVSRLQRLHNNVAQIFLKADHQCDARSLLQQLHWLPVESRVRFKFALQDTINLNAMLSVFITNFETTIRIFFTFP